MLILKKTHAKSLSQFWVQLLFIAIIAIISAGSPAPCSENNVTAKSPASEKTDPLSILSDQEKAWIKAHPDIRLAFPRGHEPSLMTDNNGRIIGLMADIWDLLNKRLGIDIKLELTQLSEIPGLIKTKAVHGMVFVSPKLIEAFDLTAAGPVIHSYVVTYGQQAKTGFRFPDDLIGRKIAVLKGYDHTDVAVDQIKDRADLVEVNSPLEGLKAVHTGNVDFFIGAMGNNYLVPKYRLFGIGPLHVFWDQPHFMANAVRSDLPVLASILNKGIGLVTEQEINRILGKWTQVREKETVIKLTADERSWLAAHPVITLGGGKFAPLDLFDKNAGQPVGIGPDYMNLVANMLGIEFKFVSGNWGEMLEKARKKEIDGIRLLLPNPDREKYLEFTTDYTSIQYAIFTQKQSGNWQTLKDLSRRSVGVMKNTYEHTFLKTHHPEIDLKPFPSVDDALVALAGGNIEAVVASLAVAGVAADNLFITNLKITALAQGMGQTLHAGIRKDWPQLVTVLNKAINAISMQQHREIRQKWVALYPAMKQKTISITREEQAWLNAHPDIQLGFALGLEPSVIVNENGEHSGIYVDFLDQLNTRLGTQIELHIDSTANIIKKAKNREIGGIIAFHPDKAVRLGLSRTKGYINAYPTVFGRSETSFKSPDDFSGKRIALMDKVYYAKSIVQKYGGQVTLVKVATALDGLQKLQNKEVDFFVAGSRNRYLIHKYSLSEIVPKFTFFDYTTQFCMAIRPDWPELVSILNKGISSFSEQEIEAISTKWVQLPRQKKLLEFSPEELEWLAKKEPLTYVYHPDWVPFEWTNAIQEHTGVISDVLKVVSDKTGITFVPVHTKTWTESVNLAKTNKVDMYSAVAITEDRSKYLNFTSNSIYSYGGVIVSRIDDKDLITDGHSNLSAKKIVIIEGNKLSEVVQKKYPEANYIFVDSARTGLNKVKTKEADLFAVNAATALYYINHRGFSDLKIYKKIDVRFDLKIAFQKRLPKEAISIVDKALGSIEEQQLSDIFTKWTSVTIQKETDWQLVWELAGVTLAIAFSILLWSWSLKKQVQVRTNELSEANWSLEMKIEEHRQSEKNLRKSEKRFRATFEQAAVGMAHVSPQGQFLRINEKFCDIIEYQRDELLEMSFQDITYPEDLGTDLKKFNQLLAGDISRYSMEKRYITKEKKVLWVHLTVSLVRDKGGQPQWFVSVIKDISQRKLAEDKIQEYQGRLKALASKLTLVEEKERSRIAAELHDHIGQTLAFSRIQIERARKHATEEKQAAILEELSESMLGTIRSTKELVFDLSSPLLKELGLSSAIADWLKEQIFKKQGIQTEFIDNTKELHLSSDLKSIMFRNVRELLTNIVKHAKAERVAVTLERSGKKLKIIVEDDGIGFDPAVVTSPGNNKFGFGLFSIKERMIDFGGTLEIISTPGKGCRIVLSLSIPNKIQDEKDVIPSRVQKR